MAAAAITTRVLPLRLLPQVVEEEVEEAVIESALLPEPSRVPMVVVVVPVGVSSGTWVSWVARGACSCVDGRSSEWTWVVLDGGGRLIPSG